MQEYFVEEFIIDEILEETGEILSDKGDGKLNLPGESKCKVSVYTGEGQIPHFHITAGTDKNKIETCVCIYSNSYFLHGGYESTLDTRQLKALRKWLDLPNKNRPNLSNWEYIVFSWEEANKDCRFPDFNKVKTRPELKI